MQTTEAQARDLMAVAKAMRSQERRTEQHPGYRVFIMRQGMPIPMSTAGPALSTAEEAEAKAKMHLESPLCSLAWVITAGHWNEVTK